MSNNIETLRSYKKLLDEGIISQSEFDEYKKGLLENQNKVVVNGADSKLEEWNHNNDFKNIESDTSNFIADGSTDDANLTEEQIKKEVKSNFLENKKKRTIVAILAVVILASLIGTIVYNSNFKVYTVHDLYAKTMKDKDFAKKLEDKTIKISGNIRYVSENGIVLDCNDPNDKYGALEIVTCLYDGFTVPPNMTKWNQDKGTVRTVSVKIIEYNDLGYVGYID